MQSGKFYALAESPQLFKQLLMCAGFERYFQSFAASAMKTVLIVSLNSQIDIECSFINQDDPFT